MEESERAWLESKREKRKGCAWTMKKKFRFQWGAFLMFLVYGGLFFLLFGRIVIHSSNGRSGRKSNGVTWQKLNMQENRYLTADRGNDY